MINNYTVTSDPGLMDKVYSTTPKIRAILNNNFPNLDKKKFLEKLLGDIEKYPSIPQFKQQLATAYTLQKNTEKAFECNEWMYKEHPSYLFAILNKAFDRYNKKQYGEMIQFLGEDLQITSLYPDRKEFHIDEIMNYLMACALYRNATEPDNVQKDIIIEMMEDLDKESMVLYRTLEGIEKYNIETYSTKYAEQKEKEKTVKTKFVQTIPKSYKAPTFEIPLFKELYKHHANIEKSIIAEILLLPQEVITHQCQKIIDDSIARFDYFMEDDNETEVGFFIIHVLLILGETGNPKNLPLVLDILSKSEDYCEFYLGDFLTEEAWSCVYKLAKNDIKALTDFLKKRNVYMFCKTTVCTVLEQYHLSNLISKEELIKENVDLLSFFLTNKNDDTIIDTLVVAEVISLLIDLNAVTHYPLIEKMYEEELVSLMYLGTLNEMLHDKKNYKLPSADKIESIYEIYENLLDWERNNDETYDDYYEDIYTPIRTEPKIGRNDPCPCGSGKKFKKCCLDKDIF